MINAARKLCFDHCTCYVRDSLKLSQNKKKLRQRERTKVTWTKISGVFAHHNSKNFFCFVKSGGKSPHLKKCQCLVVLYCRRHYQHVGQKLHPDWKFVYGCHTNNSEPVLLLPVISYTQLRLRQYWSATETVAGRCWSDCRVERLIQNISCAHGKAGGKKCGPFPSQMFQVQWESRVVLCGPCIHCVSCRWKTHSPFYLAESRDHHRGSDIASTFHAGGPARFALCMVTFVRRATCLCVGSMKVSAHSDW